ncbi:uncharacterized protein BCR38DRAFT_341385 [Pseudomassariella vexata]|uniref:phosphatidylinositol-3,4,5-trisphosphate 3-phosphatase n=1 Tax=Pseudomassariella vexata TaxID=1141098 RepID=A0A1Y2DZZ3_9PEZI|nr:uncharacterized protein BCR38DRAFT_341385 [Pseudomassariella vexata]ORY64851.1 hypothetical protein BCR38DRAFT_341385 [Pseudomassariella vexata]
MASLLRQIVAGPRARHPEAGLDLCYVTDNIVATSGPSQTYPQRAYRNPLDRLVTFLDAKHGKNWAIWEFRAEGTGYPDHLVYDRIRHYPWPDHHPPPFRLVPMIVASMRNWLNGNDLDEDGARSEDKSKLIARVLEHWKDKKNGRVVVVHCKAGKGRSGTMACSFLISECGWTPEQAINRFTERRMRPKFGPGVSIPSQVRWIGYVDRWTKGGKKYVDREIEIVEIHVWGLRSGVKLSVEGFVDEGKKIKVFHTFNREERLVVEGDAPGSSGIMDSIYELAGYDFTKGAPNRTPSSSATPVSETIEAPKKSHTAKLISPISRNASTGSTSKDNLGCSKSKRKSKVFADDSGHSSSTSVDKLDPEPGGRAVIFKPKEPIRVPTSDVNITLERRNRAPSSMGLTMVTAVAHVWFNAFFEGDGPEQGGISRDNGVFEIEWDKMDGIKGSSQKGTRAMDRIAVVWRSVASQTAEGVETGPNEVVITEPSENSPVPQMQPADWKGGNDEDPAQEKKLGLRVQSPDSANVSQASSINEEIGKGTDVDVDSIKGVRSDLPGAEMGDDEETRGRKGQPELEAYAEKLPSPEGSGMDDGKK